MKKFLELGNAYAKQSDWTDFALTKFCLCSMGVMIGMQVPKKYKEVAMGTAATVFAISYAPLMYKVGKTAIEMMTETDA